MQDLGAGYGRAYLPAALARKYPNADREWGWQYLFPAGRRSIDPRDGRVKRHHPDESVIQRAVKEAKGRVEQARAPLLHPAEGGPVEIKIAKVPHAPRGLTGIRGARRRATCLAEKSVAAGVLRGRMIFALKAPSWQS